MHSQSKIHAGNETAAKDIVVIGAGVVGLSSAIRVQERGGYRVTIVAETFPTDPKTICYTSQWAGAHHVSGARGDKRQRDMDKETFEVMWKDLESDKAIPGCFFQHDHQEFRGDDLDAAVWLDYMPGFRPVSSNQLPPGAKRGWTFRTFTMYPPVYLTWLLGRFLANGGMLVRVRLLHIQQAMQGGISGIPPQPAGVVVCVGIGARFLGGVEDADVYPIRGQTVMLRAPWVRYGRTLTFSDGSDVYLMPRVTGDVLVGGIRVPNDWYPAPRQEDRDDILTRVLALCEELAPPDVRAKRTPTIEDLRPLIVDEGCGLRPGRRGGIRLETEWFEAGPSRTTIPVVYNYGHGGMGFQSSWGSASIAVRLLEEALVKGQGGIKISGSWSARCNL